MQHRHRAFRLDRIVARTDRVLPRHFLGTGDDVAQGRAGDRFGIEIDEIAELRHQLRHAAGMMEVLHVMFARRLQVDQHRHLAAELVEGFEIDAMLGAVGNRGQMDEAVGRAADRLQHHLRIPERRRGQEFARPRPLRLRHRGGDLAAGFRRAKTFGMRRGDCRTHRQRQAQRFGDAGHGGGRAHHHAGADRWRQPAVDGFDLDVVDFTGAVFAPQPPAIGAGAQHLALVMPDHHRPDRDDDGRQVSAEPRP